VVVSIRGFAPLVKKENAHVIAHCLIHRKVLVSKTLGDEMKQMLDDAATVVNLIKQRPVQSRMLKSS
jgi:hypothetical protein